MVIRVAVCLLLLVPAACSDDSTPVSLDGPSPLLDQPPLAGEQRSLDQLGGPDLAGGDGALPAEAGPDLLRCQGSGLPPGDKTITLSHDGRSRSYLLHVPKGYSHQQPVALLLAFHGLGGNPVQFATQIKMNAESDAAGFVVAYPAGVQSSWNAGSCCGDAAKQKIDDVGFARAVVADLQKQLCLDPRRIYATGFSNGGFMSHRLACEAADLFAAVAPVAGGVGITTCQPSRPVPLIHFHGTADTLAVYKLATTAIAGWISRNGCTDPQPTVSYKQGTVTCETRKQCQAAVEVTLCTVEGGGHCWPGLATCTFGTPTTDISANQTMWELFKRFSLP